VVAEVEVEVEAAAAVAEVEAAAAVAAVVGEEVAAGKRAAVDLAPPGSESSGMRTSSTPPARPKFVRCRRDRSG